MSGNWRFAGVLLLATGLACPKRQTAAPARDADQSLAAATAHLQAKRYKQAEDGFTFTIFNFPGTHAASDAQFYLAESYYESRDYLQAQTEYDFYIQNFPSGRFHEEAQLKLALACLKSAPGSARDQSRVTRARDLLDDFIGSFPDSRLRQTAESARAGIDVRLAEKEFDAARLYFKAGEYRSALVYYQYLSGIYPEARWPDRDRRNLAVCYAQTGADRPRSESASVAPVPPEVIYFDHGSYDIRAPDSTALVLVARRLSEQTELKAAILGFCDSAEAAATGESLPAERSAAVQSFLVRHGVDPARVRVVDAGPALPVPPEDQAVNRRVEVLFQ